MYDKENEYVPLNFETLSKNPAVWEVIKEELQKLDSECLMKIITAAKVEGMKDEDIFLPLTEVMTVEYQDPFGNSIEEDSEED